MSDKKRAPLDIKNLQTDTLGVRAGVRRTEFNEHSEAMFLTSSFCFDSAADAAHGFANAEKGFIYSRFTNPTVAMFQDRLAAMEGGEACIATSSGMSAIMTVAMSHLQAGDHVVCSRSVFGATIQLFTAILGKFGIETTYVDMSDLGSWKAAVKPNTKLFYLETPSNPLTEVADIAGIAKIAKAANALYVVDNCFCTPALQKPIELGADVVIHSATKYLDGQGRVLGGAVVGTEEFILGKVFPYVRTSGPTLSAFNAWVILKGLETLNLRVEKQSQAALELAQQKMGGPILSFTLKGGKEAAWKVIDGTKLLSITANLGDTRTTITHPATTTHVRVTPEARAAAGITDSLVRIAVGLENIEDIKNDLLTGLKA
ncbi:MAG: hypothetical protein RJB21_784 [Pseudomonadota bacterium]|jgi:O-succinylhomoserine sulfhydrylase